MCFLVAAGVGAGSGAGASLSGSMFSVENMQTGFNLLTVDTGSMKDLFCEFKCYRNMKEGSLVNRVVRLEDALRTVTGDMTFWRHFLILLQSSGYGKTKECIELLKKHRGLYLLCGAIAGSNTWNPLPLMQQFVTICKSLSTQENLLKVHIYSFLVTIVNYVQQSKSNAQALFLEQFDENTGGMIFSGIQKILSPGKLPPVRDETIDTIDLVRNIFSAKQSSSIGASANASKMPISGSVVIIIFDESHELGPSAIRWIKFYLDELDAVGIFLSTCSHVEDVLPPNLSNRSRGLIEHQPIFYLPTTDLYSDHLFHFGRPLWKHQHNLRSRSYVELVNYARYRLVNSEIGISVNVALSLFMCRFGSLSPVNHVIGAEMVKNHMATYSHVGWDLVHNSREVTSYVHYISEPILVEASMHRTSMFYPPSGSDHVVDPVVEVLQHVKHEIQSSTMVSVNKGDIGEIVGSAILGYTMDYIRAKAIKCYNPNELHTSLSGEVTVSSLLESFCGKKYDFATELESFHVNFTHFIRLPESANLGIRALGIRRHLGFFAKALAPGIDIFVDAYSKSSLFATNTVATKNVKASQTAALQDVCETEQAPLSGQSLGSTVASTESFVCESELIISSGGASFTPPVVAVADVLPPAPTHASATISTTAGANEEIETTVEFPSSNAKASFDLTTSLTDLKMCPLRVSIKNYANKITRAEAIQFLNKIHPDGTEPLGGNSDISVAILINVGAGGLDPFVITRKWLTRRCSSHDSKPRQIQMALSLNSVDCFVDLPREVKVQLLQIAAGSDQPKYVNSAMYFGNDIDSELSMK